MPKLSLPEDDSPKVKVRFRGAGAHHAGGAWKVSYADFFTALMALFIVLWLMNAKPVVKASVSGYFADPRAYLRATGMRSANNSSEGHVVDRDNMGEVRKQLEQALRAMPEFDKLRENVKFSLTEEGLRVDLLENQKGMFFISGSAAPTRDGEDLLRVLAVEISRLPNHLVIEGHTDAQPFRNAGPSSGYSNWELASDRANAARRLLHSYGVRPEQVVEVRGFADQRPFNPVDRFDARNRRVSIVVRFTA